MKPICEKCNRRFPAHLIAPMNFIVQGHQGRLKVCPICALKIRNKMHGLPENECLRAKTANDMYQEAVEYLKTRSNHDRR